MNNDYIEFDDLINAIDNLEMTLHFLNLDNAEKRWKWTLIAIHQALYGFAILTIRGTDPRNRTERTSGWLISIDEALARAKDAKFSVWLNSVPLRTTRDQDKAIERLVKEFRNSFEHFKPGVWAIEISVLPRIVNHIMDVIRFLAFETHSVMYQSLEQETYTKGLIDRIIVRIDELKP